MSESNIINFSTMIKFNDLIVRDHRVHGVRIMPGVTFLDIIYRGISSSGINTENISIKNIVFKEPIATTEEYDKKISVTIEKKNSIGIINVKSLKVKDGLELTENWDENLQCELHFGNHEEVKKINIEEYKANALRVLDIDEAYSYTRKGEINHFEFMKALGLIYEGNDYMLSEHNLSEIALEHYNEFYLHPAHMDSSTIVPALLLLKDDNFKNVNEKDMKPYIPIFIDSFYANSKISKKCYVLLKKDKVNVASSKDIVYVDVEIYNDNGVLAACIKRLANKRIREKELISKLKNINEDDNNKTVVSNIEHTNNVEFNVQNYLLEMVSKILNKNVNEIDVNEGYYDQGLNSTDLLNIVKGIEKDFSIKLYPTLLFEYTTIKELSDYLMSRESEFELHIQSKVQDKEEKVQSNSLSLNEKIKYALVDIFNKVVTKVDYEVILDEGYYEQGLDSTDLMNIVKEMENRFNVELYPTLLFEYTNINDLADFLYEKHGQKIGNISEIKEENPTIEKAPKIVERSTVNYKNSKNDDIAVIGLSARYPKASNVEEFWEVLKEGKDCITEIPKDRWDHSNYYSEDKDDIGKSYSKWGGFIDDLDKFDPLFFNISPKEAEFIDPQERIFLESVWNTFEDAGYKKEVVSGKKIGVYVGVMYGQYQLLKGKIEDKTISPISFYASIANRVSYYFNLKGPSIALDTMCSSSLTTIHLACESIRNGESEMAVAGGVNITIHPNKYVFLSYQKFASSEGKCRAFGEGGDGYVCGEGVGSVLLKPLNKAIEDGDRIYGVIKGSSINSGGKSSGFTVPNVSAQSEVIEETLKKTSIDASTISYIEAHGTGTALGDPIEISALTKTFDKYTDNKSFCAIGSVKSNIGHLESAAGIASFTKTILQIYNKQLVPTLHVDELNHKIDFEKTPFKVQKKLENWKERYLYEGNKKIKIPRRAGVSSFGAGGSNAYILLEEYSKTNKVKYSKENESFFIPLSAKNSQQLNNMVERLLCFLNKKKSEKNEEYTIENIAYTLQLGREEMSERIAFIVKDIDELIDVLQIVVNNGISEEGSRSYQYRNIKKSENKVYSKSQIDEAINNRNAKQLALLWINNNKIDWTKLYKDMVLNKVSLPTYPFAKERYWVSDTNFYYESTIENKSLHPLIDYNESNFYEQKYVKKLMGNELYLRDHIINGEKVLPGVIYLEMARAAAELAGINKRVASINNVLLLEPIVYSNKDLNVDISLNYEGEKINYEINTLSDGERILHSTGNIFYEGSKEVKLKAKEFDINEIKAKCKSHINSKELYEKFRNVGFDYGNSFKGVKCIDLSDDMLLAEVEINEESRNSYDNFKINPTIVDSALQVTTALSSLVNAESNETYLPFSFDSVNIFGNFTDKCYVYAVRKNGIGQENKLLKYDINILNEKNETVLALENFSLRSVKTRNVNNTLVSKQQYLLLEPTWQESQKNVSSNDLKDTLVIFDYDNKLYKSFKKTGKYKNIINVKSGDSFKEDNENIEINPIEDKDYSRLFSSIKEKGLNITEIIFNWKISEYVSKKETIVDSLNRTIFAMVNLVKGLMKYYPKNRVNLSYLEQGNNEINPFAVANSSLFKTIKFENDNLNFKYVNINGLAEEYVDELMEEFNFEDSLEVKYQGEKRYIKKLKEIEYSNKDNKVDYLKDDGVYIITGGAGGLGLIFAKFFETRKRCKLILTGRSSLNSEIENRIDEIKSKSNSEIIYIQTDIVEKSNVHELVEQVKAKYGHIDGVIHSAGVLNDSLILNKKVSQAYKVLNPKIMGAINLDEALKNENLDFFVMFSSTAAITGNLGQSDYSFANGFMDEFVNWRNNNRSGQTISINWPLWSNGGMKINKDLVAEMKEATGVEPLSETTGLVAFDTALSQKHNRMIVFAGDKEKIKGILSLKDLGNGESSAINKNNVVVNKEVNKELNTKVIEYLKSLLGKEISLATDRIDEKEPLEAYGIDSVMIVSLTKKLEKTFGTLSKTLFFEYQTIDELSKYFLNNHLTQLISKFKDSVNTVDKNDKQEVIKEQFRSFKKNPIQSSYKLNEIDKKNSATDMAIIGVSGVYPMADNLDEFWENMLSGLDCITEIPENRWDYKKYYDSNKNNFGTTYAKWGSFISSYDMFDPLFFNISPREAEFTDPQERLFLQVAWNTIEDAAYTKNELINHKVGVFVGVMSGQYQFYGVEESLKDNRNSIALSSSYASIANRVSYTLDLHGPSMAVDTMCSSSLTALKLACMSIAEGDCDMAIAGGVNLNLHSNKYIQLAQGKFASTDGKCRSFGNGGDGYVPGEGVGAILVKRLDKAIEDGDNIHAIIKGCSINHGGKTNGYSVPNPNAQTEVINNALIAANINPRTISYIEAHGTGTALGDPIEITGLKNAFSSYSEEKQYCAIGSVKSNIGHLESAAGIAGITKVILQLKNKTLVPSLHSNTLNSNIDFDNSPFYVEQKVEEWKETILINDGKNETYPRRAGVSCFGAGGSNGHVILEEYIEKRQVSTNYKSNEYLFVLSARNNRSLMEYCRKINNFIKNNNFGDEDFNRLIYSLQVGRQPFEERIAIVVSNRDELIHKLDAYIETQKETEDMYMGNSSENKDYKLILSGDEGEIFIEKLIDENNFKKIAQLWVKGIEFDWNNFYVGDKPIKLSLPTYPFEKERYWVPTNNEAKSTFVVKENYNRIHPMIDKNVSTLYEERFTKELDYNEFYLSQHRINNISVLPAVAYLEIAVVAANIALENKVNVIRNVKWLTAVEEGKTTSIDIGINVNENNIVQYEIASYRNDTKIIHSSGEVDSVEEKSNSIDISNMLDQGYNVISQEEIYKEFKERGISYGSSFRSIEEIVDGKGEFVLTKLIKPKIDNEFKEYILPPSIMDVAFQSIICLLSENKKEPYLPYGVDEVLMFDELQKSRYVYVEEVRVTDKNEYKERQYNASILDEKGNTLVKLMKIRMRRIDTLQDVKREDEVIKDNVLFNIIKDISEKKLSLEESKEVLGELYD